MARPPQAKRLDASALEQRTQAIGRELFAAAKREHAHLSALNRWTAQVLSWCLGDPAAKAAVLRFIDVLPSLQDPRDMARHLLDYFPDSDLRLPGPLRLGSGLARRGLLTHGALATVIRQLVEQLAQQFIAESKPQAAARVIAALAERGATCSLDILGEQVLSEAEADGYLAQCQTLLKESVAACGRLTVASCGPRVNLSVKPSALTPHFDPASPMKSVGRAANRLLPLLEAAGDDEALLTLDMEQYELRNVTLDLAKRLLVHPTRASHVSIGVVIQAYLLDADRTVDELLAWLSSHERTLAIRLVRGAYWDVEVAQAQQLHWPIPVYQEKALTDAAFERLVVQLLGAAPLVITAIASHNVRSLAYAMAVAEQLGLPAAQLEFQFLYGMGDALQQAVAARGYPVRVYTPIGQLLPGMAYLVRRLLENTANESFLRQEFLQERTAEELLKPPAPARPAAGTPAATGEWNGEPVLDFAKAEHRDGVAQALNQVRAGFGRAYPLLIGGEALESSQWMDARNPARPEDVLGRVAQATRADADRAVACAAQAQPRWASLPVEARVGCLRRAAELLRRQRYALAALEIIEVGKPWREADADIMEAIEYLEYYGRSMLELGEGKPLWQRPGERNLYRYLPRGVAVVIAPWNFPAAILTGMASAALVTGHPVILKPAEQSSIIAAHLVRMLHEAGVPPAAVQFLPGDGSEVGAALVAHPATQLILFTGSKAVGLSILAACGKVPTGQRAIKHVVAELGGKNAVIVDADADVDAAVSGVLRSAFGYAGQKCSAASRVIVHRALYDRFLERLAAATDRLVVEDPADPDTDVGPLIDADAQRRLAAALERAQRVGRVAYRYPASRTPPRGYFVPPAIVEVPPRDALAQEELFGPLVCCFRADTFSEALALANDTDFALTGGVYSRSPSHIEEAMRAFDVGNLYINRPITGALVGRQPFGGHRLSGLGTKAGGPDYLVQLLLPKTICVNTTRHGLPLE